MKPATDPPDLAGSTFDAPLTTAEDRTARALADRLEPGCRVVMGDGAGAPLGLLRPLAQAARSVGGLELVLGWYLGPRVDFPADAFPVVRTSLGGYGLAGNPRGRYTPVRLSAMPALLAGPWAPHLLLVGLAAGEGGPVFGTEVSWMAAALRSATATLAEVNHALPAAAAVPGTVEAAVVSEVRRPPRVLPRPRRSAHAERIGEHVARLIRPGAAVQVGPGFVGDAVLGAIDVPVRVRSGVVGDAVLGLRDRGLLLGDPVGAYVVGTPPLYDWAHGRRLAHPVEYTHDVSGLSALPLVAVNTALQIDHTGQVNVEGVRGRTVAGIGGLADFALAASQAPDGLSIIALPRTRGGRPTLVDAPASCPRSDIDVVVTELGARDLRGLSDPERAKALLSLW